MNWPTRRAACSALVLASVVVWLWQLSGSASAFSRKPGKSVRRTPVDASSPESWPEGDWFPVSAELLDEFASNGAATEAAGYVDTCEYSAQLVDGDSLEGAASALLKLYGPPAILPLGDPSFAISSGTIDQEPGVWGADAAGRLHIRCPRDAAKATFLWNQRGVPRGRGVEFVFEGLAAASGRLTLTVPETKLVEVTGGLVVGERPADHGGRTYLIELGSKSRCGIRVEAHSLPHSAIVDCELNQSISASPTKLVVQSDFSLRPHVAGPFLMDVPVPDGFSVLRVLLASGERIPFERAGGRGPVLVALPELPSDRSTVCRLVVETPVDWSSVVELPRIVPSNVRTVLEKWTVQFEKPLEVSKVEKEGFIQTGLADEQTREVWSFQRTQAEGKLRVTAGPPPAVLDARILTREQREDSKIVLQSAVWLQSRRTRVFDCELDISKPWTVVGIDAIRAGGGRIPAVWQVAAEHEDQNRIRVDLPRSIGVREPVVLFVVTAAPSAGLSVDQVIDSVRPVVAGEVQRWKVVAPGDQGLAPAAQDGSWLPVPASELDVGLLDAVGITSSDRASARAWRRIPVTAAMAKAPAALHREPTPAFEPQVGSQKHQAASAVAAIETRLSEAGANEHVTTVDLRFRHKVDPSGWSFSFARPVTVIDVLGDANPLEFVVEGTTLRLPASTPSVEFLTVRFRTVAANGWLLSRDQFPFPQGPFEISYWFWRITVPESRSIASIPDGAMGAAGIRSSSWTQRLFGPLGRSHAEEVFNPAEESDWTQLLRGIPASPSAASRTSEQGTPSSDVTAFGLAYPASIGIDSWRADRMEWLSWATMVAALLAGLSVRRVLRAAYRTASVGIAVAATGTIFAPLPWAELCGAALLGGLGAFLAPRSLIRPEAPSSRPPAGSSFVLGRPISTTVAIVSALLLLPGVFAADLESAEVLVPFRDGEPESVVLVSDALRDEITRWDRSRKPPDWLIEQSLIEVAVDALETASVRMRFSILSRTAAGVVHVPLPFEGISFQSSEAATLDGKSLRLTPTKDASGILVTLPMPSVAGQPDGPSPEYSRFELELRGQIRLTSPGGVTGLAIKVPRAASGRFDLDLGPRHANDEVRIPSRGRMETTAGQRSCWIGVSGEIVANWRPIETPTAQTAVSARAESLLLLEPGFIRGTTRLIVESPETSDAFADPRLLIQLPPGATVGRVTGTGVTAWSSEEREGSTFVTIDLQSAVSAHARFDVEYSFPTDSGPELEIPAFNLLGAGELTGHQVALATSEPFRLNVRTPSNPEKGIWAVTPSEAAFSLRRDSGLPAPEVGLELESPQPLQVDLRQRELVRIVETEQSLKSARDRVVWEGHARIETSGRAALIHEFIVDPRIEVDSVSVLENDIDRLLRFIRQDDRLLLFLRDDRPGVQIVRITGSMSVSPGSWASVPVLSLLDSRTTRTELVILPGDEGQIETQLPSITAGRREVDAPLKLEPAAEQRLSLDDAGSKREFRWLPPKTGLIAEKLVRLDSESQATLEWAVSGDPAVLAELEIDVPETASDIQISGDYAESTRRTYPHGGFRLRLTRTTTATSSASLVATIMSPDHAVHQSLPRLVGRESNSTEYWLAVPREFVERLDITGEQVSRPVRTGPAEWTTRILPDDVMYRVEGWSLRSRELSQSEPLGTCDTATVLSVGPESIEGLTSIIATPSRTGTLTILPPSGGRIVSTWLDDEDVVPRDHERPYANVALLFARKPTTVVVRWAAAGVSFNARGFLPVPPSLERFVVSHSTTAMIPREVWFAGGEHRRESSIVGYARHRADALLERIDRAPPGIVIPASVRSSLAAVARSIERHDPDDVRLSRIEAALNGRALTGDVGTESPAVDHDYGATPGLAESLLMAAMDCPQSVMVRSASSPRPIVMPRKIAFWTAATLWFVGTLIVVRRALKLATRMQIADRLAAHAASTIFGVGLLWWAFLSPSVIGILMCGLVVVSRAVPPRIRSAVKRVLASSA